jgi:hypothetical protein
VKGHASDDAAIDIVELAPQDDDKTGSMLDALPATYCRENCRRIGKICIKGKCVNLPRRDVDQTLSEDVAIDGAAELGPPGWCKTDCRLNGKACVRGKCVKLPARGEEETASTSNALVSSPLLLKHDPSYTTDARSQPFVDPLVGATIYRQQYRNDTWHKLDIGSLRCLNLNEVYGSWGILPPRSLEVRHGFTCSFYTVLDCLGRNTKVLVLGDKDRCVERDVLAKDFDSKIRSVDCRKL